MAQLPNSDVLHVKIVGSPGLRADDAAQLDKHRSVDAAGKLVERHPPGLDRVQVDPRTSGRRAAEALVRNRIAPDPDLFELAAALWSAAVKHVDSRPEVDTEALRGLREAITNFRRQAAVAELTT